MLIIVDTAIGDIRREPESGLIAGIRAGCAWALAAVPLWRDDGTVVRTAMGDVSGAVRQAT